jgi:hypothetical protein
MASDISALKTRAGKIESSVTSEQTARANADTALGKRVDTVSAKADRHHLPSSKLLKLWPM